MKRSGTIVSYTDEELKAGAAGPSQTDWAKVDAMTEAQLEAAIASDPDEAGLVWDWSTAVPSYPARPKGAVSIRLDPDVLAFFREAGRGYQTRINAVLRTYVEHERARKRG